MATALRLQTREARRKLAARDRPYYVELRRGLALGYRKGTDGGSWLMREYRGNRYMKRRIGAADDETPADGLSVLSWADAQAQALGSDRPTITTPGKLLVREAWDDYCRTRATPLDERERVTWMQFIDPVLGGKAVAEMTAGDLERWLAAQVTKYSGRRKNGETDPRELRRRAQDTANRRFNLLRAVLNSAYRKDPARVPSADAWRRVQSYQGVGRPRLRVLAVDEARRLLNALPPALRTLARGALYSGLRFGELQALTVADMDTTAGQLRVQHSKSGRPRDVPLSREGVAFFEEAMAGKASSALIFEPIPRISVSRLMRAACTDAKITPAATFHDLRRSYGSLLLNAGTPADVVQELLGHADLRSTRAAYAHLLKSTLRKHVNKHLPDFGRERANVVPLKQRRRQP
jgi:integrase